MEKIEAAAIRFDDCTWSVPQPGRHHDVIAFILKERPWLRTVGGQQGFCTDSGRFVDREEALAIAKAADQIRQRVGPDGVPFEIHPRELFSEDVW